VEPPQIWVDAPVSGTVIDDGVVHFAGRASDAYSGIFGSDIQRILFEIEGPDQGQGVNYYKQMDKPGGEAWSVDWDVRSVRTGTYHVKIWASDSAFCQVTVDECTPVEMTLEIENDNAIPVVQLLTPFDGQTITASEDTLLSGVARDTDGEVSWVEIVIKDPQAGFMERPEGPHSFVNEIMPNGGWATSWDTTGLVHNYNYIIEVRSYDGTPDDPSTPQEEGYSQPTSIQITIDNPPDQDNTMPAFNSTAWPDSVTIFCEETGASQNRCGTGYSIDLTQFFSDPDAGDSLSYYVLEQEGILEDNYHPEVITISSSGVANYNPLSMSFYEPDMADWSLQNVIFQVFDTAGSTISSAELDIYVVGVSFESACAGLMVDGNFVAGCPEEIKQTDILVYQGKGRPTVNVIGETGTGLRLGSTAVGDDGTWTMEIPANRLEKGGNTIVFEYGDIEQPLNSDSTITVEGGLDEGSGVFMWILGALGILVLIGVLGGVFFFFFVEFEEEDYEDDLGEPAVEVDPYAWAKERQQQEAAAVQTEAVVQPAVQQQAAAPAVSGYPGWKWDAEQNKWIPDEQ